MILVVTGQRGAGKTTLVRGILQEHGIPAQGFLSVKEVTDGVVTGISLLILPGGERIPMATTTPLSTDAATKRFYFYPGVFDRVNALFRDIRAGCPFILDEFGLLEREGQGHYPVFRTLLQASHPSIVMVQSDLRDDLLSILGDACPHETVDVSFEGLSKARSRILTFLRSAAEGEQG